MRKKCRRKVWALVNPIQHAIEGAAITPEDKLNQLQLREMAAVTIAEIEKQQEKMESRFEEHSNAVQGQYVEILCPHCGEAFFLDRAELNRQPAQDKPD